MKIWIGDWAVICQGIQVESVPLIGWAGIENGELLTKAVDDRFDVLVTMDSVKYRNAACRQ